MDKFVRLTAKACPLPVPNINTDQILPARFLKWPRSRGLGTVLFHDLRFDADGKERADFPLNQPQFRAAKIIVVARNFGGGSSREAAVYALYDYGIRCVIAPSFGDIHYHNAIKNGLLPAIMSEADAAALAGHIAAEPAQEVTVDLDAQTIVCGDRRYAFSIDPVSRNQLLNGWDDVYFTDSRRAEIAAFKEKDRDRRPWAATATTAPPARA
jgi:3-isopropylmalate/(R)-2-methylmalate dehydratase small subunit